VVDEGAQLGLLLAAPREVEVQPRVRHGKGRQHRAQRAAAQLGRRHLLGRVAQAQAVAGEVDHAQVVVDDQVVAHVDGEHAPVAIMLGVFVWGASGGWQVLAVALAFGSAIESVLLLIALYRLGLLARPSGFKGIHAIASASLALLPGTLVLAFGPLVEQAIAAALGEGSNAALAYGYKLPAALLGIFVTTIGITALPYFSAQIGQGRHAYSLHSLNKLALALLAGGALLALPLGLFSAEIAALLYQRGAFDAAATMRVAPIQLAYFMQIPFALVAMLGIKTLAALNRNGLLSLYTALGVLLQALLAYAFAARHGLPGIARAAVIVSALLAMSAYLTARSTLRRLSA